MPFIRLSDNYIDHPKFLALSDRAFRLWHEGMAFSRKHQTDGLLPSSTVKGFRYYRASAVTELLTPYEPNANALWKPIPAFGWKMHNYLEWNLSREEEQKDREGAADRMRRLRSGRKFGARSPEHPPERSPSVPVRRGEVTESLPERESEGKPHVQRPGVSIADPGGVETTDRAARLLERYGELFQQHRHGSKYFSRPHLDLPEADRLIQVWDDARLEKLAILFLTATRDEWINRTDRSFKIFAMKASLMDQWLTEWEAEHGAKVTA